MTGDTRMLAPVVVYPVVLQWLVELGCRRGWLLYSPAAEFALALLQGFASGFVWCLGVA